MVKLVNRARMSTSTTGTGTITLGSAENGYQSFDDAGVPDGDVVRYVIEDGANWEVGTGTYTASGTTLTRTVTESSNSDAAINLSGNAVVFIGPAAQDFSPTITLAGDASGSVTLTDLEDATLTVTVSDDSHNHVIANVDGLQADLDAKLDKSGGTMTGNLILNADPTTALGAATKEYVDTIAAAGIHYHDPVRVEKEGNLTATYDNGTAGVGATLTNSGTQAALVIDGVTMVLNDRVLIYEQTNAFENGIYTVTNVGSASTNWVLTRATDADSYGPSDPDSLGQGDAFFVQEGNAGAGELYVMNTEGAITFGTTGITFTQIQATAVYSGGTDITLSGTTFNLDPTISADTTGNAATATALETARTIGGVSFDGTANINLAGVNTTGNQDTTGNAATATAWETARTVTLSGDVSGTATGVDGSGNISITTTVADDSHAHVISNVDGLQTALDAKAPTSSPTFSGTVTFPAGQTFDGRDVSADGAKLDGIESGADVTDTANVTAAGALMDSEVTNLAQVKSFDSSDYATAAQGTTADAALARSGGQMTGNITMSGAQTVDGRDLSVDGAKLDGIEAGATADQTKADIDALGIAASTANTLATSRTISLTGDVSGSTSFDGSGNVSITATVADDSHNHVTGNIDGLAEFISDTVGAMVTGNTESGISVTYQDTDNTLDFNVNDPTITLTGAVTGSATMTNLGNVSIATTATADPTLTLSGDASGSATFTNLGNATLNVTIADDSHNHTTANIDNFTESVQDIVGGMVTGNTESGLSVTYQDTDGTLDFSLTKDPTITLTGAVTGSGTMTNLGNVSITTTATADPTLTLSGDASGSATFTNLGNATLTVTVADDSHNHVISNIDGLQSALDGKQASGTYNTIIGTDSDINTSGSTIIDNIFVTDGVITSMGTRTLTLADLGYTGATNANYITNNNQLTNGAGYTTNVGDITGVTAGTNLTGGGSSGSVTLNVSSSPTFSGVVTAESLQEDYDALSGTSPAPDADNAGAFSLTMTGNTTFTFGSVTSGRSVGFVIQLTGNGGTVTWPSSVDWAGGTAPDAPASGETDLLVFWTRDGGTTWYGMLAIDAAA